MTSSPTWSHRIDVTHPLYILDMEYNQTHPWSWDLKANFPGESLGCETRLHVLLSSIPVCPSWKHLQVMDHCRIVWSDSMELCPKLLHWLYCACQNDFRMVHGHHEMWALHLWDWVGCLYLLVTFGYIYRGSWLTQTEHEIHRETCHLNYVVGLNEQGEGCWVGACFHLHRISSLWVDLVQTYRAE